MKILMIAGQELFPANSGGRRSIVSEAEALTRGGHDVALLASCTTMPGMYEKTFYGDAFTRTAFVPRGRLLTSTLRHPTAPFQFSSRSALASNSPWHASYGYPEVIVAHQEWTVPAARVIASEAKCPVVLRSHNDERAYFRLLAGNGSLPARAYRYLEFRRMRQPIARSIRLADQVWTMSPTDSVAYRSHDDVSNVPPVLGCGSELVTPRRCENRLLSFFGALDMPHNVAGLRWFVYRVLPLVLRRVPDARLVVGGRSASEGLRAELSSSPAVDFVGEVPDPRAFIRASDCFVNPIFVGSGINIKVGDPMFAGVPIVSTSCGVRGLQSVRECLEPTDTAEEFADQCVRTILDPAVWAARANALHACASEYSDQAYVRRAESMWDRLTAGSR